MQSSKFKPFLIIVLFWILLFSGYIGYKEYTINKGKELVLKVIPVDPSDFLRGDYVILNYEISNLDVSSGFTDYPIRIGDEVIVRINQASDYAKYSVFPALYFSNEPSNYIFIRGKVIEISDNYISITYNIEKFFIQRGTGKEIENGIRKGNTFVTLSVDKFGNAVIKELKVGNKVYK